MSYSNHIIENIIGVSYGATGKGIFISNAYSGYKMTNLSGYNLSSTWSTSEYAYGIYISTELTEGGINDEFSAATLINSVGRCIKGNGMYARNVELKKCIGYSSWSSGDLGQPPYFAFVVDGNTILDECTSQLGKGTYVASVLIQSLFQASTIKINGCNFSGSDSYRVIDMDAPANSTLLHDVKIKNSILKCGNYDNGAYPIFCNGTNGNFRNLEIDNCFIEGYEGLVVNDNTSINNNLIVVKNPNSYAIQGQTLGVTGQGARVSYSNNTITGATTTNGGVSNLYQEINALNNTDTYGNIDYSRVSTRGLVLYIDAERIISYPGTGATAFDISPLSVNDAGFVGCAYTSTVPGGASGGSIFFDGTDTAVITYNSSLNLTTAITIEAFVRFSNFSSNPNIINKDSNFGWRIRVNTAGNPEFISNAAAIQFLSTATVTANTWVHLVATFDSTGGNWYVNGVPAGSTLTPYAAQSLGGPTYLGQFTGGSARLNGYLGLIRVYNRKLSEGEVVKNFYAERNRYGI